MPNTTIDLTGKVFDILTVLELDTERSTNTKYWKCYCVCGQILSLQSQYIRNGKKKLCRHPGRERGKSIGVAASLAYADYQSGAKKRDLSFDLTPEQFVHLVSQNCYYCDSKPIKTWISKNGKSKFTANGIDRVDNTIGYNILNCVPCCKLCNYAKRDISQEEYIQWLKQVREGNPAWKKSIQESSSEET